MRGDADIEQLLSHADWLRGLARHLVRGEDEAAEVVQQTWAAALRSPPEPGRPARPWLAQVLRNFVRKNARAARNRGRREASVAELQASALSPESLLEAMQLRRLLGELVLALDEPYRAVVLARYYEGLEPAEIARGLGVPAGTVRWRLSEGTCRLRVALEQRLGSEGRWRLALAPLMPRPWSWTGGLVIMATKVKLSVLAGAAVALVVGGLVWREVSARGPVGGEAGAGRPGALPTPAATEPPGDSPKGSSDRVGAGASPGALARDKGPPRFIAALAASERTASTSAGTAGRLSKDDIRAGVRGAFPAIKECYNRFLRDNPGIGGRLDLRFTIVEQEGAGRVSDATILPQTKDSGVPDLVSPATEACVLEALTRVRFAAPNGGSVLVIFPLRLAPSPPDDGQ